MLVDLTPIILVLGGIAAASWILERMVKLTPFIGKPAGLLVKAFSVSGFFLGVLLLATAVSVWSMQAWDSGTQILLLVTGLALFLKPLKDVPWAALSGLVVGGLCAGFVFLAFPLPSVILGVSSTWVYLLVFLVPALLAYLFFKFAEDVLRLFGTLLAFKPVMITLGLACIIQGILMLFDMSLFIIFFQ